jgi:hypothetical protein
MSEGLQSIPTEALQAALNLERTNKAGTMFTFHLDRFYTVVDIEQELIKRTVLAELRADFDAWMVDNPVCDLR